MVAPTSSRKHRNYTDLGGKDHIYLLYRVCLLYKPLYDTICPNQRDKTEQDLFHDAVFSLGNKVNVSVCPSQGLDYVCCDN